MGTGTLTFDAARAFADARAGDERAFEEIVELYHEDMRRVCAVVVGDEDIASQAVLAAWSVAWARLESLKDPASIRPWLISIAVNEARKIARSRRRRAIREARLEGAVAFGHSNDPALSIDMIDLRNALTRLDPMDRSLLAMRYLVGFDATELAAVTGLTPSGVRSRLARLVRRLREELWDE
jgi:RNA polymerase sigma-70 factor, ECF subfamily